MLATELGPRAAAAGHPLDLAGEAPVHARGDESRVLQIGRILVENAIVHTPPGTTVTIAAGGENGRATLSVTDDGPGIPAEARDAVFDRFVRLGGTVASGSGLGLAIARELAELMGGRDRAALPSRIDPLHARADGRRPGARAGGPRTKGMKFAVETAFIQGACARHS